MKPPTDSRARRLLRAGVRVVVVLAGLMLVGSLILGFVEQQQRDRLLPPGQLVDVAGNGSIHLRTWGMEHTAGPTIILDHAASLPSSSWAWIGASLGESYRVVAYDRPGMGWSRGGGGPRDARTSAEALRSALDRAGIPGPYVPIGHSYGGFSARMFAHLYPDEVAGLVLLDTTNEGAGDPDDTAGQGRGFAAWYRLQAWQGQLGLLQLGGPGGGFGGLPPADAEAAHVVTRWRTHLDATADELDAWPISARDLRRAGDFGDLPLLVVSGYGTEAQIESQRDLVRLSSNSRYVELPVWHTSMLVDREHAALVTGELRSFLSSLPPAR
jgi:pimeloyl-ACP methyl ester carboxylesterase